MHYLLSFLLFFSAAAEAGSFVPMATLNFENHSVGTDLVGGSADKTLFDYTTYSMQVAKNPAPSIGGNHVAKVDFRAGSNAPTLRPPPQGQMNEGDIVWTRFRVFLPNGFNWDNLGQGSPHCVDDHPSPGQEIKFLRMVNYNSGRRVSLMLRSGNINVSNESDESLNVKGVGKLTPNAWTTVEFAIKVSQKNDGYQRVWINGVNTSDQSNIKTVGSGSSLPTKDHMLIFSQWNCRVPVNQSMYIDDIMIATNRSGSPTKTDQQGRPYIGMGDFVGDALAAPLPPRLQ